MKKIIICNIPMREYVANTVYSSEDRSLLVSDKPYRYPINSLLSQAVNAEDDLKIILLIKKIIKIIQGKKIVKKTLQIISWK